MTIKTCANCERTGKPETLRGMPMSLRCSTCHQPYSSRAWASLRSPPEAHPSAFAMGDLVRIKGLAGPSRKIVSAMCGPAELCEVDGINGYFAWSEVEVVNPK